MEGLTLLHYTAHTLPSNSTFAAVSNTSSWLGQVITRIMPEYAKNTVSAGFNTFTTLPYMPLLARITTYAAPVAGALITVAAFEAIRFAYHEYQINRFHSDESDVKASDKFIKEQMNNIEKAVEEKHDTIKCTYDTLAAKKAINTNFYQRPITSKTECAAIIAGVALSVSAAIATGVAVTTALPACLTGGSVTLATTLGIRFTKKAFHAYRVKCIDQQIQKIEKEDGYLMVHQSQKDKNGEATAQLQSELQIAHADNHEQMQQIATLQKQLQQKNGDPLEHSDEAGSLEGFYDAQDEFVTDQKDQNTALKPKKAEIKEEKPMFTAIWDYLTSDELEEDDEVMWL